MRVLINILKEKQYKQKTKKKKQTVDTIATCHLNKPKWHYSNYSKLGEKMAHYTKRGTVKALPLLI